MHVRLPDLGLLRSHTPADDDATQTTPAPLRQAFASGAYRLVILDGIHKASARGVLDVADLRRLVNSAADGTEVTMT